MMNKLKGFTVAETLVTLGIIGVIAAVVLPILNDTKPNEEMIMLKKAYYNTARVVSELINDEELYPEYDEDAVQAGFSNRAAATYNGASYSGASKFCNLFAAKLNAKDVNCSARRGVNDGGNFKTIDGIVWSMPFGDFSGTEYIAVDTNGAKRNNCSLRSNLSDVVGGLTACSGTNAPDQFVLSLDKFGAFQVVGNIENQYVISTNTARNYRRTVDCVASGTCNDR